MSKLHPDVVRLLRRYYAGGYSIVSLVEAFGLSRRCVYDVVKGRTHKNVIDDNSLPPLAEVIVDPVRLRPRITPPSTLPSLEELRESARRARGQTPSH